IENSTARDVYDVIRSTPNASWHDSDLGLSTITLRGIGSYGASQVGSGTIYGTATAIVLDGVALPRAAMGFSDLSAFDLDQVEIFRGPQSTSQGRNAMAGAVILNTAEPEVEDGFYPAIRGRVAAGNHAAYQGAAVVGVTLWPDKLAVRIVSDHRADNSDIHNTTREDPHWAGDASHGTRLRANFTPFGIDGAYQALASIGDIRRSNGNRYVEQTNESKREATADEPSYVDSKSRLYSLDQRLKLGEDWHLRSISAYARSTTLLHLDVDYSADADGFIAQTANSNAFSQELRATFDYDNWRGTFGLYYFKGLDGEASTGKTALLALLNATGLCPLEALCNLPVGNVLVDGDAPARIQNKAIFGEVDWHATEALTLTAGLRLDHEQNSRRVASYFSGDNPATQAGVLLLQTLKVLGPNGETNVGRSFSALLPKIAASYELFHNGFIGAAYAEGYRPGGEGYNYGSGRRYSFDAERTQNYELSFKGSFRAWKTQYALNLFRIDWSDMQVPVGSLLDSYIANAGNSRINGGELEVSTSPFKQLRIVGGLGITRGRFIDFVSTAGDFSGNPLPKAPKYSGSLALEWSPLRNILIRPEVQRTGSSPAQSDNKPGHQITGYTLLNLSLRWNEGNVGLFFNGSNLTDRNYRQDAATPGLGGGDVAALGYGRSLMGGLEFQFK
ncbi:MAG: TonB-dependent receptor, partial [Pseudomonadota bacterium]